MRRLILSNSQFQFICISGTKWQLERMSAGLRWGWQLCGTLTGITSELDTGLPRVVEQTWEFCGDWEVVDLANSVARKAVSTPRKKGDMGLVDTLYLPGASNTKKEPERWAKGLSLLRLTRCWPLSSSCSLKGRGPVMSTTRPNPTDPTEKKNMQTREPGSQRGKGGVTASRTQPP